MFIITVQLQDSIHFEEECANLYMYLTAFDDGRSSSPTI